jgi:two-component system NarL family sensor kinase
MEQGGPTIGIGLESVFADQSAASFPSVFHKLVDELPEQIALLDEHWDILSVNRSWAKAINDVGFHDLSPGSNYREFCARRGRGGDRAKALIGPALDEMDRGEKTSFSLTYSGDGELAGRDYETRIGLFQIGGHRFATITRIDLTELHDLRRLRQGLAGSLDETRQLERERIGRELHDSTMQFLIGAALSLGHLRRSGVNEKARGIVTEIEDLLVKAQNELRSISYLAHAHDFEGEDLGIAIRKLVEGFARRAGMRASVDIVQPLVLPDRSGQIALYRVLQEAISNVHRHSGATEIGVRLVSRGRNLVLIIADNGIGFSSGVSEGVGLRSMYARLRDIGGQMRLRHLPKGIAIVASAPLATRAAGAANE